MPVVQGWRHLTSGKAGSSKARGGGEDGEAVEGGQKSKLGQQEEEDALHCCNLLSLFIVL